MSEVDKFLKIIEMIESSGGQDLDHPQMQHGIHKGHRATGRYGLMPNTIDELTKRLRRSGAENKDELELIKTLSPKQKKQYIESHPKTEEQLARYLADHVLKKQQGDEEKAAYSWHQGHNKPREKVEKEPYQTHPYTQKYKSYSEKLFPNVQKSLGYDDLTNNVQPGIPIRRLP